MSFFFEVGQKPDTNVLYRLCVRERREKEERSRRARERQQAVMREFARRQQQFLSAMRAEAGDAMDWEDEQPARDYDCVICNTTAPATHHDPIGLVVLLQVTNTSYLVLFNLF